MMRGLAVCVLFLPAGCGWSSTPPVAIAASVHEPRTERDVEVELADTAQNRSSSPSGGEPYGGTGVGDVIVATIKSVSTPIGTNEAPPHVTLEVHEVLRGNPQTDRTNAVWQPPPHDFDWGGAFQTPAYLAWTKRPLAAPPVGQRMILWGGVFADPKTPDAQPRFYVNANHRYDYSDQRRVWAIADIRDWDDAARRGDELRIEQQRKYELALADWRARLSSDELHKLTTEAELVVVGKIVSQWNISHDPSGYLVAVDQPLKGIVDPLAPSGERYVEVEIALLVSELLWPRDRAWIMFLRENPNQLQTKIKYYFPLLNATAVVEADEAALQAVRSALRNEK